MFDHKTNLIKPKKAFKKFSLNPNLKSGTREETTPGETGVLINGVEISNYKTDEKIYYGPLTNVSILIGGSNYDVLNLPKISTASPSNGSDAKVQPVISGELKEIIVDSSTSNFNIKSITGVNITGGNVSGGSYELFLSKKEQSIYLMQDLLHRVVALIHQQINYLLLKITILLMGKK